LSENSIIPGLAWPRHEDPLLQQNLFTQNPHVSKLLCKMGKEKKQ